MSTHTDHCIDTLEDAIAGYGVPEIFNTDQGSQFTSGELVGVLKREGTAISMDGKGCWRDNEFVECTQDLAGEDPIETFTVVAVPTLAFLGQAHDRSSLMLRPEDYKAWLEGGPPAQSLIGPYLGGDDAICTQ